MASQQHRSESPARPPRVTLYGGASDGGPADHRAMAEAVGKGLAENGFDLVYGGGSTGIMGAAARGAFKAGGYVTGVIPRFLEEKEITNRAVKELHIVDHMHPRKQILFDLADIIIVAPGGIGTLDEFCEVLTWKQLKRHNKPIIMANFGGYWDPMLVTLKSIIDMGYWHNEADLWQVATSADEVVQGCLDAR